MRNQKLLWNSHFRGLKNHRLLLESGGQSISVISLGDLGLLTSSMEDRIGAVGKC